MADGAGRGRNGAGSGTDRRDDGGAVLVQLDAGGLAGPDISPVVQGLRGGGQDGIRRAGELQDHSRIRGPAADQAMQGQEQIQADAGGVLRIAGGKVHEDDLGEVVEGFGEDGEKLVVRGRGGKVDFGAEDVSVR